MVLNFPDNVGRFPNFLIGIIKRNNNSHDLSVLETSSNPFRIESRIFIFERVKPSLQKFGYVPKLTSLIPVDDGASNSIENPIPR